MRSTIKSGLVGAAVIAGIFCAPATRAETLEEALSFLLLNHPQIRAGKNTVASTDEGINVARAGYLPIISMSADTGYEYIDNPARRAVKEDHSQYRRGRESANLNITQNLFNGFATEANTETARLSKEAAIHNLNLTRQLVSFEGISTYLDVLRQQRLIDLSHQNEDNVQTQLELEDERVQQGAGIAVEVLQAKSRLQVAKERRVAFEGAAKDSFTRYNQVFQRFPETAAMSDPRPPIDFLPQSVEEAVNVALRENPAVGGAIVVTDQASTARKSARAAFFPTVDLVLDANWERHVNATVGTRLDYSMLLQATWTLYEGGATRAAVAQSAFDYAARRASEMNVNRQVEQSVRLAWQALETSRERLVLLENAVNIATEVYRARQELEQAGKETGLVVLDSAREIFNAQINLVSASYDMRTAVYQVLLSMGRLDRASLNIVTGEE
ncbi:MAG: TolC family outer membrane protein [Rhodospirillales bacterium]